MLIKILQSINRKIILKMLVNYLQICHPFMNSLYMDCFRVSLLNLIANQIRLVEHRQIWKKTVLRI